MKNNSSIIYAFFLIIGDFLALVGAFSVAYILRVKFDDRPLIEQIPAETYLYGFMAVLPLWIIINFVIGLYRREVYDKRFAELGKLIVGTALGMLVVIGYDFIIDGTLFPARLVAVYGFGLSLVTLILFRMLARGLRAVLFSYGIGLNNVLIIGDGEIAQDMVEALENSRHTGPMRLFSVSAITAAICMGREENEDPARRERAALLRAGGRSLIEWQIMRLASAGFRDLIVNVSHLGEEIEAALGESVTAVFVKG